jgi:hypothetical protein
MAKKIEKGYDFNLLQCIGGIYLIASAIVLLYVMGVTVISAYRDTKQISEINECFDRWNAFDNNTDHKLLVCIQNSKY